MKSKAQRLKNGEAKAGLGACVNVCGAAGCQTTENEALRNALVEAAAEQGYGPESCAVRRVGCLGLCGAAPLVSVEPAGFMYQRVQASDASDIIAALNGPPVKRIHLHSGIPFFTASIELSPKTAGASIRSGWRIISPPTAIWP